MPASECIRLLTSSSDKHLKCMEEKKIRDYWRILIISVILVTKSVSNRKLAWISQGILKVNITCWGNGSNPPIKRDSSWLASIVCCDLRVVCPLSGARDSKRRRECSLHPEATRECLPMGGGASGEVTPGLCISWLIGKGAQRTEGSG